MDLSTKLHIPWLCEIQTDRLSDIHKDKLSCRGALIIKVGDALQEQKMTNLETFTHSKVLTSGDKIQVI